MVSKVSSSSRHPGLAAPVSARPAKYSTRAVWFSSTATSWSPNSFSCRGLPNVGRRSFQLRRYRTIGCQPACRTPDRTLSTLGLIDLVKLSVDVRYSIARRRNWRTTAARRCSSSAAPFAAHLVRVCLHDGRSADHRLVSVASQLCCLGQSVSHCGVGAANRIRVGQGIGQVLAASLVRASRRAGLGRRPSRPRCCGVCRVGR